MREFETYEDIKKSGLKNETLYSNFLRNIYNIIGKSDDEYNEFLKRYYEEEIILKHEYALFLKKLGLSNKNVLELKSNNLNSIINELKDDNKSVISFPRDNNDRKKIGENAIITPCKIKEPFFLEKNFMNCLTFSYPEDVEGIDLNNSEDNAITMQLTDLRVFGVGTSRDLFNLIMRKQQCYIGFFAGNEWNNVDNLSSFVDDCHKNLQTRLKEYGKNNNYKDVKKNYKFEDFEKETENGYYKVLRATYNK